MANPERNPNDQDPKDERLEGEIMPVENAPQKSIELRERAKMRKLSDREISELGIDKSSGPFITSAVEKDAQGREELIYIMTTSDGSAFKLDKDHTIVQELQFKAASAAIDSFEVQTPIQTAQAIIRSIKNSGYVFEGGLMEAWDFAIEALDKMISFQKRQLELDQINMLQTTTRQLTEDMRLGLGGWAMLPPHRREASIILTRLGLAAAVQQHTTESTVEAAQRLKLIDELFNTMAADKATKWAESRAERAYTYASKAKEYVADILSQGNASTSELAKTLLAFVYGDELKDDGVIKATLERSGDAGHKLMKLIEDSGLTINQFFKNLTNGMFKEKGEGSGRKSKSGQNQDNDI